MSARKPRRLLIPVTLGESYQDGLLQRLDAYGITRRALAEEMRVDDTQVSRWLRRTSEYTNKPISIGIENVVKMEMAILKILERRAMEDKASRG